ncbi:hypothetical protein HC028_09255 [Planosporangium flavigriseum]|uniref:Uncharacterized protein n=1 Tax=Planosporangium flavigriseum TaxID=373681 RepID=A0A8J3PLQ8_9ACTN|nr:hypothetical protein [Planosporangium flavigriseum]NJC64688.1 hypothetical protein [Planosporangium flavigriseum]GIG74087.1 hypothetical protein Pfl04_24910 [Planosporangium flavigriseum]
MKRSDRNRAASREVWALVAVWLGLGDVGTAGPSVRRGAAFLVVQSAIVVALVAAIALVKPVLFGGDIRRGWPYGLLLLVLPIAAGIAHRPAGLLVALAAAVPVTTSIRQLRKPTSQPGRSATEERVDLPYTGRLDLIRAPADSPPLPGYLTPRRPKTDGVAHLTRYLIPSA